MLSRSSSKQTSNSMTSSFMLQTTFGEAGQQSLNSIMDEYRISFRNCILAIWNQLTRKGAWRNVFVTHNAFGIFSKYSHISRRSGKPKIPYPNKKVALRAAEAMSKKHGVHFSVYKCAWCDGWHIGKNAQNKITNSEVAPDTN